jgi:DNA helicase-2/ATP-dependent DNA helicase PcrA
LINGKIKVLPKDVKLEKSGSIIKSILKVYEIYQNKTKDLNAFDFGDLILFCVKLFEEHKDIREIYQKNFKYILVDEFQDTNFIQNKWLNLLVNENKIFVVLVMMINQFIVGEVQK